MSDLEVYKLDLAALGAADWLHSSDQHGSFSIPFRLVVFSECTDPQAIDFPTVKMYS